MICCHRKHQNKFEDKILELNGVSKPARTWAYDLGITLDCLKQRMKGGLPLDEVLVPPKRKDAWK